MSSSAQKQSASTLDPEEIARFSALAERWWDENGEFAPLHRLNPARLRFIRDCAAGHFEDKTRATLPLYWGADENDPGLSRGKFEAWGYSPHRSASAFSLASLAPPQGGSDSGNAATPITGSPLNPLCGLSILDIGCGGGLVAEPLARLGARVLGIDGSARNIEIARLHAQQTGVNVEYRAAAAEELAGIPLPLAGEGNGASPAPAGQGLAPTKDHTNLAASRGGIQDDFGVKIPASENRRANVRKSTCAAEAQEAGICSPKAPECQYDVVLALEVVEHVADVELFLESCARLVKPGGLLILSTLNRTPKAYALAILGAEYLLRWLPRGTHDWKKFLKPHELVMPLERRGLEMLQLRGLVWNPFHGGWSLSQRDLSVNYLLAMHRP